MSNYETALAAAELGIAAIPCKPGTKIPLVKWKPYQHELPTPGLLKSWFEGTRNNIAIVTTGMVLFDVDDPAQADRVLRHCGDTSHKLRSPRGGVHLGYRKRKGVAVQNQVDVKGLKIDIRTDGGLEMVPNSETEHGRYEWLGDGLRAVSELPVAKISWTRERTRRRVLQSIDVSMSGDLRIRRARAYIASIVSISGEHGHNSCYRAVCKLRDFGLSASEAWPILAAWNETNARPPWSEQELRHKIASVYGDA